MHKLPSSISIRSYIFLLLILSIWIYNLEILPLITEIDKPIPQFLFLTNLILTLYFLLMLIVGFIQKIILNRIITANKSMNIVRKEIIYEDENLKCSFKLNIPFLFWGFQVKVYILLLNSIYLNYQLLLTNKPEDSFNYEFNDIPAGKYLLVASYINITDIFDIIKFSLKFQDNKYIYCLPKRKVISVDEIISKNNDFLTIKKMDEDNEDDFYNLREFQSQDEKRLINWKISAKKDKLYVKYPEIDNIYSNQIFVIIDTHLDISKNEYNGYIDSILINNLILQESNKILYSLHNDDILSFVKLNNEEIKKVNHPDLVNDILINIIENSYEERIDYDENFFQEYYKLSLPCIIITSSCNPVLINLISSLSEQSEIKPVLRIISVKNILNDILYRTEYDQIPTNYPDVKNHYFMFNNYVKSIQQLYHTHYFDIKRINQLEDELIHFLTVSKNEFRII